MLGAAGNAQGAADFGAVPQFLPGYQPAPKAGMGWPEMFSAIERGALKGLYLIGVDPYDLGLSKEQVKAALAKLQFLVVQDCVPTGRFGDGRRSASRGELLSRRRARPQL